jgi:branched-chain amino acid transport system substrate-binding protein
VAASGKESAEGVLNYMLGNPASETYKRLASEYKRVNGHDMNDVLPAFYDATRVLFAAMQKAGTVSDTEKVRLAIPKVMPFAAALGGELNLAGKSTYGADTQILTVSYVGEIRKGEVVILGVAK